MRALIVTNMWPTADAPWRGSFVRDQVAALRERGEAEVHVLGFPPKRYAGAALQLRRRLRGERFDVVHAHFGLSGWPALAVPARTRVVTLHGTDLRHPRSQTHHACRARPLRPRRRRQPRARRARSPTATASPSCPAASTPSASRRCPAAPRASASDWTRTGATCCCRPTPRGRPSAPTGRARSPPERNFSRSATSIRVRCPPTSTPRTPSSCPPTTRASASPCSRRSPATSPCSPRPSATTRRRCDDVAGTLCAPYDRERWSAALRAHLRGRRPARGGARAGRPVVGPEDGRSRAERLDRAVGGVAILAPHGAMRAPFPDMKRLLPRPPRRRASVGGARGEHRGAARRSPRPGAPAGAEPEDPAAPPRPSFRNRGRLRRRLRYLRRVRELGFRDLGGLVFEQHKFRRPDESLVRGKLTALAAVDTELRTLEEALRDRRDVTELREPGHLGLPALRHPALQRRPLLPELRAGHPRLARDRPEHRRGRGARRPCPEGAARARRDAHGRARGGQGPTADEPAVSRRAADEDGTGGRRRSPPGARAVSPGAASPTGHGPVPALRRARPARTRTGA